MEKIQADLIYYNANSRDSYVGDCVKRALAVAYSMDYDAVSAELNRIKRAFGYSQYNINPVFEKFMKVRGDSFTSVSVGDRVTAEEFCKQHPNGVYLILVGERADGRTSHIAAIVDGNLYDSWNSLNWYVYKWSKVSSGKSDVYEIEGEELAKEVASALDVYVKDNLSKKAHSEMQLHTMSSVEQDNKYTFEIGLSCKLGTMPKYSKYYSNRTLHHYLIVKINPRLSYEENLTSLTKKIKQKAYDWVYNIKADITEGEKLDRIGVHPNFTYKGSTGYEILRKLPEWAVPRITCIWDNGEGYSYGERFEVTMEALPEDPRVKEDSRYYRNVEFYADSLRQLKEELDMYKDDYSRINYEY